jgi:hypothetical protein
MENKSQTRGRITGVLSNLVSIEAYGPVGQNEICYIELGNVRLTAEVIRVAGNTAQAQVFESTRGIRYGDKVEFTGRMLEMPHESSAQLELVESLLSEKEHLENAIRELADEYNRYSPWGEIPPEGIAPLAALWDFYQFSTGLLGDFLSYIRLFALALAGGLLGNAFNQIAFMLLPKTPTGLDLASPWLVVQYSY